MSELLDGNEQIQRGSTPPSKAETLQQADHAFFLNLLKNDPEFAKRVNLPANAKSGLAPQAVAEKFLANKAAFQHYASLPDADKASFWSTDSAERSQIEDTLKFISKEWSSGKAATVAKREAEERQANDPDAIIDKELEGSTANPVDQHIAKIEDPKHRAKATEYLQSLKPNAEGWWKKLPPAVATKINAIVDGKVRQWTAENEKADHQSETDKNLAEAKERLNKFSDNLTLPEIEKLLSSEDLTNPELLKDPGISDINNKLQGIQGKLSAMPNMASNDAEKGTIANIVHSAPISWKSDEPAQRYASLMPRIDQAVAAGSLSEETATKIYTSIGIAKTKHSPTVKGGKDVQDAMDTGAATQTYTKKKRTFNTETGEWEEHSETITKSVPYAVDNRLEIAKGQEFYQEPDGRRIFRVTLPSGRFLETEFTKGSSPDQVTQMAYTMQTMHTMATYNLAEPIWKRGRKLLHGRIDLHYSDHIKARDIGKMFLGGAGQGSDGTLQSHNELDQMMKTFKFFTRKEGAAKHADDPETGRQSLQELGIITPERDISWTRLKALADFVKANRANAGAVHYQQLKDYIERNS